MRQGSLPHRLAATGAGDLPLPQLPEAGRVGALGNRSRSPIGAGTERRPSNLRRSGDSGQPVYRHFCPDCGSPVLTDMPKAGAQGIIFIKAGTLDEVSDLKPATHYWTDSAQGWAPFPPDGK